MTTFEEGNLAFDFDDSWHVLKYDEETDYRSMVSGLQATKGVDFIGVQDGTTLFFIEVKDFRGHRIEARDRLHGGALADEIGHKVRDTVAGIVGFQRTSTVRDIWRPFLERLADTDELVKAIVWLENDLPRNWRQRRKVQRSISTNVFKRRIKWLTSRVLVCSVGENCLPDVDVRNLPGAGKA